MVGDTANTAVLGLVAWFFGIFLDRRHTIAAFSPLLCTPMARRDVFGRAEKSLADTPRRASGRHRAWNGILFSHVAHCDPGWRKSRHGDQQRHDLSDDAPFSFVDKRRIRLHTLFSTGGLPVTRRITAPPFWRILHIAEALGPTCEDCFFLTALSLADQTSPMMTDPHFLPFGLWPPPSMPTQPLPRNTHPDGLKGDLYPGGRGLEQPLLTTLPDGRTIFVASY